MRKMFAALALLLVVSLAGAASAEYVRPKLAVTPPAQINRGAAEDFLLLHDGDHVRVLFREEAGRGSIRFLSLSADSRLDIINPLVGAEKYVFGKEQGWQTYPHAVAGQVVTVILRETGTPAVPGWDLPGCSDAVVRIENAAIFAPHDTEEGGPGVRCPVCGAVLDW